MRSTLLPRLLALSALMALLAPTVGLAPPIFDDGTRTGKLAVFDDGTRTGKV